MVTISVLTKIWRFFQTGIYFQLLVQELNDIWKQLESEKSEKLQSSLGSSAAFENTISNLRTEIETNSEFCEKLKTHNTTLSGEKEVLQGEVEQLSAELNSAKAQMLTLADEYENNKNDLKSAENQNQKFQGLVGKISKIYQFF